jgi:hypothetical protein
MITDEVGFLVIEYSLDGHDVRLGDAKSGTRVCVKWNELTA